MEIRRVTVMEALSWFGQAMELFAKRPLYLLGVIVFLTMISFALGRVPLVGSMLCAFISPFFFVGLLLLVSRLVDRFELRFEDLLAAFTRPELVLKILPLSALSLLIFLFLEVSWGVEILEKVGLKYWLWVSLSVGLAMLVGVALALPLVIFEPLEWREAVALSLQAVAANLKPLGVTAGVLFLAGGLSSLLSFLLLPYTVVLAMVLFMAYRRIFEPPEPVLLAAREVFEEKADTSHGEEPAPC